MRTLLIRILAGMAGLLALAALLMLAGAIIQGPVTTYRVLRYGDSTIEDYKLFPARRLTASKSPFPLADEPARNLGPLQVGGLGSIDLEPFLEQTGSIAFLVVRGDTVVSERYFSGHGPAAISQAFSASKSVLSILVGAALQDGIIRSVDQSVTDYVPELSGRGFDDVSILDLLHMKSGMDYVENDNPFGIHVRFNYTPRLEDEILALRHSGGRPDRFIYKSGDSALLALILKRALGGKTITQYTQERLWDPLGMGHDGLWSLDREEGMERTWCCLSATARDFAKFGMLYRDGGVWRGVQVVPRSWVDASVRHGGYSDEEWRRSGEAAAFWNYGYQWWLADRERGDYIALGKDGQYIYVDPASDTVIVRLGYRLGEHDRTGLEHADWVALFQAVAEIPPAR